MNKEEKQEELLRRIRLARIASKKLFKRADQLSPMRFNDDKLLDLTNDYAKKSKDVTDFIYDNDELLDEDSPLKNINMEEYSTEEANSYIKRKTEQEENKNKRK